MSGSTDNLIIISLFNYLIKFLLESLITEYYFTDYVKIIKTNTNF